MLFTRVCVWSVFASLSALLPCSVTQLPAMLVLYLADCLLLAWASVECQSRTCAGRQNLLRGRKAEFVTWGDSCELTIHSAMIPCLGRSIRCRHVPPTTQRSRARCWHALGVFFVLCYECSMRLAFFRAPLCFSFVVTPSRNAHASAHIHRVTVARVSVCVCVCVLCAPGVCVYYGVIWVSVF